MATSRSLAHRRPPPAPIPPPTQCGGHQPAAEAEWFQRSHVRAFVEDGEEKNLFFECSLKARPFSKYLLQRKPGKSQLCGRPGAARAAHFFSAHNYWV